MHSRGVDSKLREGGLRPYDGSGHRMGPGERICAPTPGSGSPSTRNDGGARRRSERPRSSNSSYQLVDGNLLLKVPTTTTRRQGSRPDVRPFEGPARFWPSCAYRSRRPEPHFRPRRVLRRERLHGRADSPSARQPGGSGFAPRPEVSRPSSASLPRFGSKATTGRGDGTPPPVLLPTERSFQRQ